MNDYLASLPYPAIIETLDYEAILAEMVADAAARFVAAGIDYDVGELETDPVKIVLEAAAYRELNLRARANDVARAQILSFARAADLDHLAGFYEVERLEDETDERLRGRVVEAIRGRSPAGSAYWYRAAAMAVDTNIRDVSVQRAGDGPALIVTVLSVDNDGIADQALLDAVEAKITSDPVRVVSDDITVAAAVFDSIDIAADVWLIEGVPQGVFDALEATLRAAWDARQAIGLDLTRSWITAALHQPGVQKVEIGAPAADVIAVDNRAVALGTVTLTFKGFAR